MPDAEYILRIILRARDEMAKVLAQARGELKKFGDEVDRVDSKMEVLNKRFSGMNTRLTNLITRVNKAREALQKYGDEEDSLAASGREVIPVLQKQETTTRRLGDTTRRTERDTDSFSRVLDLLSGRVAKTGDNIAALDNKLRGMAVLGVIVFAAQLNAALIGLGGTLISVAGSAAMAGGAIGGNIVGGIAQALPMIGIMVASLVRLNAVFDAVGKLQDVQLQQHGRQQQAQRRTADTTTTLANAHDTLADSHRGVAEAEEQVTLAREQLTRANQEARREIEDLMLAQRQAAETEEQAQKRLQQAIRQGRVEDIAQLRIDADRARIESQRATQDAGTAQSRGVRGSDTVRDARRNLDQAREGVRDAERAVVRASRSIDQARRGAQAAEADTFAAASALDYMLAQLSPAERQLYNALRRVRRAWNDTMRPITDIMIGSFERATDRVTEILRDDRITRTLRSLTRGMSREFDRVFDAFTSDKQLRQFQRITRQSERNLKPIGDIAIGIGRSFANIAESAGPSLNRFLRFVRNLVEEFEFFTRDRESMTKFFNEGERHLEQWVKLALSVVNLFMALVGAGSESGLKTVEAATNRINEYAAGIRNNGKEAAEFFENAREATGKLWEIVEALAVAMFDLFQRNPERINQLADFIIQTLIPALVTTIDHVGDLSNIFLAFLNLPIISDLAKWMISFLLFAKVVTGLAGVFSNTIGLVAHFIRIVPGLDRVLTTTLTGISTRVKTTTTAFSGLGTAIRGAFSTRSLRPIIDFLRGIPGRIRSARTAAAAPQVGGAVVDGRRGPQAPAGAGIDPRRGPQAPAPIVAPVPRRRRIPGGGLARGVGGGLGIYGLLDAAMADEETYGQLGLGDRFQKGASTATLGILPGLKTTDERVKVIIERIRELRRVVKWDEITGDWDDFTETQQKVIRRTVTFHNEVIKLRERFKDAAVRVRDLISPEVIQGAMANMERLREGGSHSIAGMRDSMRRSFALINEGAREGSASWYKLVAQNFGAGIDSVLKNIKRGEIGVGRGMKEIDRITRVQMKFARDNMEDLSGEARDALAENFRRARIAVTRQAGGIENATGNTLRRIRRLMRLELELYGMPPSLAKRLAEARSQGDLGTSGWGGPEEGFRGPGAAGGGRFGLKGERGKDGSSYVPTGRGEIWVANAAHQGFIDDALHRRWGFGFDQLVSRVRGAHAGELGGGFAGGFAGQSPAGYRTVPIPGFPGEFIAQRVLGETLALVKRFKLFVTDAFATSGHSGQGHLHFGTAVDATPNFAAGGSWDLVDRAVNFFRRQGGTVLYNETAGHGRGHHAHFEMANGIIRGIVNNARRLRRRINRSIESAFEKIPGDDDGGVMGGIGKQASRNVAEGAIRRFRRAVRDSLPSYAPGHAPAGALSETEALATFRQAFKLALPYAGHDRVLPGWLGNLLNLAKEESSLRPGAQNLTAAGLAAGTPQGILQVVIDTFKAYMRPGFGNPFNPLHNAIASIRYQLSRYGTIQRHAPYAMGGEIPGQAGAPVPILAHAKEWIVNPIQQSRLAQWIGTSVDSLRSLLGFHGGPQGAQGGAEVIRRRRFRRSELPTDFGELSFRDIAEDVTEILKNSKEFAVRTKKGTERYARAFRKLSEEGGLWDQMAAVIDGITTRLSIRSITMQFARRGGRIVQRIRRNAKGIDITQEEIARTALDNLELISGTLRDQRQDMRQQLRTIRGRLRRVGRDPAKRLEQIGKLLEDAEGEQKKDLEEEQKKLQTRQGRRAGLEGMRNRVRGRLRDLDLSIAENMQSRYEAQVAVQQTVIDRINREAETKTTGLDLFQRVAAAVGNEGAIQTINQARRDVLTEQANQLEGRIQAARNIGNEELARQLEAQVGDLRVTIFESIQQEIADAAERINAQAGRRMARLDLFERMATALGAVGLGGGVTVGGETLSRSSVFGQRGAALEAQRAGLQGVLRQAEAAGNMQLVQDLTDQLAELEVAIAENTAAQFQAQIEDVNSRASFALNINDLNRQVLELNGTIEGQVNQTALLALAQERGNILSSQRVELEALLLEAQRTGNQQAINDLTTQLLENQVAILQNTQAINELNGAVTEPQTFSSTAWQWFRQAIFTGMGTVQPQYQVPGAQTGAMIMKGGMLVGHAGEIIRPAVLSRPSDGLKVPGGNHYEFNITEQPAETDYEYLGETIARKVKTVGV